MTPAPSGASTSAATRARSLSATLDAFLHGARAHATQALRHWDARRDARRLARRYRAGQRRDARRRRLARWGAWWRSETPRYAAAGLAFAGGWFAFWWAAGGLLGARVEVVMLAGGVFLMGLAGFRWAWTISVYGLATLSSDRLAHRAARQEVEGDG